MEDCINNGVKKSTGNENIAKIAKSCEAVCSKYNEDR